VIDSAIVGLGRWGRSFVESVQGKSRRIRFVRGVETNPEPARAFAAQHGFAVTTSLDEVLADPSIHAVVLATPHSLHREQVIAGAKAGKHVFCEKPLALSSADARAMIAACETAGIVLGVGHNRRFWPAIRELKRIVDSGELGELMHIEGHNSNENSNRVQDGWRLSPHESPGGGMTGAGLHVLDTFTCLFGPVRRVRAQVLSRKPEPAPLDTASAIYEFENGASGLLATIRATPFYWRIHAFGTLGSAEVLGETELVRHHSGAKPEHIHLPPADSLLSELEAFADAIDGRAPFPVTPAQMLDTVEAFEATVRALETGLAVEADAGSMRGTHGT
jgi:predicted dehydrogenase